MLFNKLFTKRTAKIKQIFDIKVPENKALIVAPMQKPR